MYSYVEFPFLIRIENFVFAIFLLKVFLTVILFFWISSQAIARVLPKVKEKWLLPIIGLIAFSVTLWSETLTEVEEWLTISGTVEVVLAFLLPLLLITVLLLRSGKKGAEKSESG